MKSVKAQINVACNGLCCMKLSSLLNKFSISTILSVLKVFTVGCFLMNLCNLSVMMYYFQRLCFDSM